MLVEYNGHLLVSKCFPLLCVFLHHFPGKVVIRVRRITERLVMAFSPSAPWGAGRWQGGAALKTWKRRMGRRDEGKAVLWGSLPSLFVPAVLT